MQEGEKRVFFGFSIEEPWPHLYPKGRILDETSRHLTFAFLGNVPYVNLEKNLDHFPKPSFDVGPVGICDDLLFLKKVVAQHVKWLLNDESITSFQSAVQKWLSTLGFSLDPRPHLPHVTIARAPFEEEEWRSWFEPLPCMATGIHLYESVGNLTYQSIWEIPLLKPFEEIEHTADIAFHIRGKSLQQLYLHAAIAMSFKFPPFLHYIKTDHVEDLNQVVKGLNQMIAQCDLEIGCPFKAVSYHTHLIDEENWEMIIDV